MSQQKMQSCLKNNELQEETNAQTYYNQKELVKHLRERAYYYNTDTGPTKESIDFARGFALGYFKGCNSSIQLTYMQGDIPMTNSEVFESFKQINTKLDGLIKDEKDDFSELINSIHDLDKKVDSLQNKEDSIFKSKQLWIPVICSVLVAILTAFLTALFEGKI